MSQIQREPGGQNRGGVMLAVAGGLPFHSGHGSSVRVTTSYVSGARNYRGRVGGDRVHRWLPAAAAR
jgi:hypothetical protein